MKKIFQYGIKKMIAPQIAQAAKILKDAQYIILSTGAGMGVDSGLPDFRGNEGFWNHYPPYKNLFSFQECANPAFLEQHPELFWGFYGHRMSMYRSAQPHEGHMILQNIMESKGKDNYFCFTSNVDGHLPRVFGYDKVYQVHGSINHTQCTGCYDLAQVSSEFVPDVNMESMKCRNIPSCPKCSKTLRPNILMFGDYDWNSSRSEEQEKRFEKFQNKIDYQHSTLNKKDGFLVLVQIGAGSAIATIRSMNERRLFQNKKARLIRINPEPKQNGQRARMCYVQGKALKSLKAIEEVYKNL